ncbi:hypothetical protein ACJPQX_21850, partial [Vibrio vulnificus]|uniref:hypothetical protein n=1 Tax=Vibrio vulnificus TaxID=672 RepID=UPI003D9CA381
VFLKLGVQSLKITGTAVVAMFTLTNLSFGFLLGCTFVGDYFTGVKWTDVAAGVGALIGGGATAVAAFFAYRALSTWKDQFAHSQRYEAIIKLEKNYYQLLRNFETYKESTLWVARIENGAIVHPDIEKLANDNEPLKYAWLRSVSQSKADLEWVATFCTDEEVGNISNTVDLTEGLMENLLATIPYQKQSPRIVAYSVSAEQSLSIACDNIKKEFCTMRKQTHNKAFKTDSQRSAF